MNTYKTDIVVIGSGIAGLSAALSAAQAGADVIVLEKRKVIGGNSRYASGIFACRDTDNPAEPSVKEISEKVIEYHRCQFVDPKIINTYLNKTADTIEWLKQAGVCFIMNGGGPNAGRTDSAISFNVPSGTKRNGMYNAILRLHEKLDEIGVQIFTETAAGKILKEDGKIIGVQAIMKDVPALIHAGAVVIATGGFTGNKQLLKKYFSYYRDDYEGHMIPHNGDGLVMAEEAGAALYDRAGMVRETQRDWAPSYLHFPLILALKQKGFVAVNKKGQRVISENFISDESNMTCNILDQQPEQVIYIIYDDALIKEIDSVQKYGPMGPLPGLQEIFGILNKNRKAAAICQDLEEAAEWIGSDPVTLRNTINTYNSFVGAGEDKDFYSKSVTMTELKKAPFYVLKIGPLMIDTIGPVKINYKAEVLDQNADSIPGLYCAGVAAGGWSSDDYCARYQFGSCIGFSCNYGRVAGENAAEYMKSL